MKVLVVFFDSSLGGTCRSALQMGKVWKELDYEVEFFAAKGTHPERKQLFAKIGTLIESVEQVDWDSLQVVNFHHGSWSPGLNTVAEMVVQRANGSTSRATLLTNNIFAVRDEVFNHWRGNRITGVLGFWAMHQYRAVSGSGAARSAIVPNPQDDSLFRPPSTSERDAARRRLNFSDSRYALRIGSPNTDKWSTTYTSLTKLVIADGHRAVYVGVPPDLAKSIETIQPGLCLPTCGDDLYIRDLYWASDVFVLDSRRGESFGNVALEALLCGLPVVYRARPYRDNTPWELRNVPGFTYVRGRKAWLRKCLQLLTKENFVDYDVIARSYGTEAVQNTVRSIIKGTTQSEATLNSAAIGRHAVSDLQISALDKLRIKILHNPVLARVKERRIKRIFK